MLSRLKNYLQESWIELKRVNWPTRKESINLTLAVIVFSIIIMVFLGALDGIFGYLIKVFVLKI
ncbi:MAG: preprotein translocase subunit SecE [Candidatus Wolfebacteria bacterium]|nr:preprotein translocase subunit SecE [Candidatus Wolfebacteria bacterium]